MKVFYSWQLDSPRETNKDLIRGALDEAAQIANSELSLTEAERESSKSITIVQDTQDVLGSPAIAQTIYRKIAEASLVVCDVTLVAAGTGEKKHINSNVAIELGYALGKNGDECVLKVMNEAYAPRSKLPFDLRERRHPICYDLAKNATKAERKAAQSKLAKILVPILAAYASNSIGTRQFEKHEKVPSTDGPSKYWKPSEPIVSKDTGRLIPDLIPKDKRAIYLRLLPKDDLPNLTSREARDIIGQIEPWSGEGHSIARNQWGAVSYVADRHEGNLFIWVQLHKNRELWLVDLYHPNKTNPEHDLHFNFIPMGALINRYARTLGSLLGLCEKLGYRHSFSYEIGLDKAENLRLIHGKGIDEVSDEIFESSVVVQGDGNGETDINDIYNHFVNALFAESGQFTPKYCLLGS